MTMTKKKILSLTAAAFASTGPAFASMPLSVTVEGVEARGGTFYISVQTEEQFMSETGTDGSMISAPDAGTITKTYDLPAGEYAVTVWHDDDGNGEFDFAATGMPLDGWAMSGTMPRGEPTFSDAKVVVTEDGGAASMTMTYGR